MGTKPDPRAGVDVEAGSDWDLIGWRSARNSFSNFSILVL